MNLLLGQILKDEETRERPHLMKAVGRTWYESLDKEDPVKDTGTIIRMAELL